MESFGRYKILERLGVGGMGEVFRARAEGAQGFQKDLVLKVILPDLSDDPEFETMFVDEAKIAVLLQHANVVQVFDLGEVDNRYFIAMEYVDGRDLSRILKAARKRGVPIPVSLALFIVTELLKGLDYAHKARDNDGRHLELVHRDVTPQNVLVSFTGEVKLSDFGIARVASRSQKTAAGTVKGKFAYMPPEQIEGGALGPWSDVFAAGLVFHTMLSGAHPLAGRSEIGMADDIRAGRVPSPSELNENLTPDLDPIVLKAIAPKVENRYRSAREFLEALEEFTLNNRIRTGARFLSEFMVDLFREELVANAQKSAPSGTEAPTSRTPSQPSKSNPGAPDPLAQRPGSGSKPGAPVSAPRRPTPSSSGVRPPPVEAPSAKRPAAVAPVPAEEPIAAPTTSAPEPEAEEPRTAMVPPRPVGPPAAPVNPQTLMMGGGAVAAISLIAFAWVMGTHMRGSASAAGTIAEAPRADRPVTATHGWLDFDIHPWAECTIDGKPVGATPLSGIELPPGPHVLEYKTVDGHDGKIDLKIEAGRSVRPHTAS